MFVCLTVYLSVCLNARVSQKPGAAVGTEFLSLYPPHTHTHTHGDPRGDSPFPIPTADLQKPHVHLHDVRKFGLDKTQL